MTSAVTISTTWEQILHARIPLYGHRNWIVVADSAYPAQSQPGIETILADADQLSVVGAVARAISNSKHVKASIYTDRELQFVPESDAAGVSEYRSGLERLLTGSEATGLAHEEIIAKLDQAARMFNVMIIKTGFTVPYTSVFFELGCAYWTTEAEARLRSAIQDAENE